MRIGLIGGTGIDEMNSFACGQTAVITTKWGSAQIMQSRIVDREVVFVPRHGADHQTPPSRINYRAQIAALKKLDVNAVISVCAVGSLQADILPGSFAVLADFIDLTKRREDTFFDSDTGPVVHTDFTQPYCPSVSHSITQACIDVGAKFEATATYVGVEGPRYESPTEIRLYASWGGDVIGMTNLPEVVLAREAGLCYGAIAVITNLACGISPTPLNHVEVRKAMTEASEKLHDVIHLAIAGLPDARGCDCSRNCQLSI